MTNRLSARVRRLEVSHSLSDEERVRAHCAFVEFGIWPQHEELRMQVLAVLRFRCSCLASRYPSTDAAELACAAESLVDDYVDGITDDGLMQSRLLDLHARRLAIEGSPPSAGDLDVGTFGYDPNF